MSTPLLSGLRLLIVEDEFLIADLATIEKRLEKLAMEAKRGKRIQGPEKELLAD